MAIADMVDANIFSTKEELSQAILQVRNNTLPF
jgi:hypothetical protein